jgi:glc operon protein GlcG
MRDVLRVTGTGILAFALVAEVPAHALERPSPAVNVQVCDESAVNYSDSTHPKTMCTRSHVARVPAVSDTATVCVNEHVDYSDSKYPKRTCLEWAPAEKTYPQEYPVKVGEAGDGVLFLTAAKRIAAAAEAAARARGATMVIAIVDDGGHLLLLHRLDDTRVASVDVGIVKARTAEDQIKAVRIAALALADGMPLPGGIPIMRDGKVIGAIGVSGDTPEVDEDIAIAGASAFK